MRAWFAASLLLAAGCTTTEYMRDATPTPPPGPDEAKVVVYRTAVLGGVDNFPVYDFVDKDGKLLGFTETDCYFEYRCEPGRHLFLTWGEGEAFIDADLAPGKTYYIQAWSKFGILSSRPGFAPAPPGSDAYRELEEAWSRLRCRELNPSRAPSYEYRKEDRVLQARADYEAGRPPAKTIIPDEGLSEPSLQAK
jgi:hypothetical protein